MKKEYVVREACFACSSPYQILGAIATTIGNHLDADLVIFNSFSDYDKVAERIKRYEIFKNVYLAVNTEIGLKVKPTKPEIIREMIGAERIVDRFLDKNVSYQSFYYSSKELLKSLMLKVFLTRNPDLKRVILDEGMGTYSDHARLISISRSRRFLENVMGWKLDDPENTVILAYVPELVHYPAPFDVCKVEQIPRIELTESNAKMIHDVYLAPENGEIPERCIIFDTKRQNGSDADEAQMLLLDRCYEMVAKCFGSENVIIKSHPRSTKTCSFDVKTYPYPGIPAEALYTEMPDLENRVLVTFVSTAVFTPKMLFDKEPIVICLHRIVKDNRFSAIFSDIFEKFRHVYHQQERILAPESFEELEKQLQEIRL